MFSKKYRSTILFLTSLSLLITIITLLNKYCIKENKALEVGKLLDNRKNEIL